VLSSDGESEQDDADDGDGSGENRGEYDAARGAAADDARVGVLRVMVGEVRRHHIGRSHVLPRRYDALGDLGALVVHTGDGGFNPGTLLFGHRFASIKSANC
jgi:hypothetical protein